MTGFSRSKRSSFFLSERACSGVPSSAVDSATSDIECQLMSLVIDAKSSAASSSNSS